MLSSAIMRDITVDASLSVAIANHENQRSKQGKSRNHTHLDNERLSVTLGDALFDIASNCSTGDMNLRVLPSFVVDAIFMWTGLVFSIASSDLQHLRFIEELMMEAEHFFIFSVSSNTCCRRGRHR